MEIQIGGLKEKTPDELRAELLQQALAAQNSQILGEVAMPGVVLPVGNG